jgi:hypothetical protein
MKAPPRLAFAVNLVLLLKRRPLEAAFSGMSQAVGMLWKVPVLSAIAEGVAWAMPLKVVRLWNLAEGVTRTVLLEMEVLAFLAAAMLSEIVRGA